MNNMAYYTEPDRDEPCFMCEHREYDSFHDETWCGHEPEPDGLGNRLLVDKWGHCEYFTKSDLYKP